MSRGGSAQRLFVGAAIGAPKIDDKSASVADNIQLMCAVKNRVLGASKPQSIYSKIKSTQKGGVNFRAKVVIGILSKKERLRFVLLFFTKIEKRKMNRKGKEEERGGKLN